MIAEENCWSYKGVRRDFQQREEKSLSSWQPLPFLFSGTRVPVLSSVWISVFKMENYELGEDFF